MEQKELPQEILKNIDEANRKVPANYWQAAAQMGAQIAQSHYEPIIEAKDTTIKEQAEKIEKLTGLLKREVTKKMFPVHGEPAWDDFKEQHGI